jgi:CubicO group peptidase (beta-lactamase class C family)
MRLSQLGMIDLTAPSADYITALPTHHTHTVVQTISNRSGIGHYAEYSDIEDNYDTALAAAQALWDEDDPLPFGPPDSTYKYSTHAYTFLGASLEGAVGQSIFAIVPTYLTDPFNLDTLRIEGRHQPDPYRSTLYDTDNDEVAADDLSWKVLGGGLESSAYDLARFGMQVMQGTILNTTSRNTLWTPPDSLSNYALGWNTGTEQGAQVVAKSGAQLGARTYIRMYPQLGIVIVVLTNRKDGGHNPVQLAMDIGTLLLDAYLPLADARPAVVQDVPDEPHAEAMDPARFVISVSTPTGLPTAAERQEEPDDMRATTP